MRLRRRSNGCEERDARDLRILNAAARYLNAEAADVLAYTDAFLYRRPMASGKASRSTASCGRGSFKFPPT